MKVYQVHLRDGEASKGYSYHLNKRAAKQANKDKGEIFELNVEISRAGILMSLNTYASHPDNGFFFERNG